MSSRRSFIGSPAIRHKNKCKFSVPGIHSVATKDSPHQRDQRDGDQGKARDQHGFQGDDLVQTRDRGTQTAVAASHPMKVHRRSHEQAEMAGGREEGCDDAPADAKEGRSRDQAGRIGACSAEYDGGEKKRRYPRHAENPRR